MLAQRQRWLIFGALLLALLWAACAWRAGAAGWAWAGLALVALGPVQAMRVSLTDHFPAFISQAVRERRLELASAGC